jgi:hypothetical protein
MAEMNTLLATLGDAIASDSDVATFCDDTYDKEVQVLENCDARDEPLPDDCPLVVISPVQKQVAYPRKLYLVGISCIVHDESKTTSGAGVVRFDAGRNCETFRTHVLAAVVAALPTGLAIADISSDYNTIEQYPFVSVNMVMECEQTQVIGGTPRYE